MRGRRSGADVASRPLMPGARVRVLAEPGHPQGTVVRVLPLYGVVTVALDSPRAERMYPADQVEVLEVSPTA
ncbi:MAG: hypothetical protein QN173_00215 [Armatimonadota bacterium]|nr:hypothetical protein [Armatimonadota bacterium]MDR7400705.1 hypothetical protein [Armatimonadota bacterium]MDR7403638.1 hypothetical protein [Armatimonadota bacterium]MDR7436484.1 hypothetical protein [Armatimonadota bacterium]MDR7472519.1 hypothetical protein [Armatimonadota bacterium]